MKEIVTKSGKILVVEVENTSRFFDIWSEDGKVYLNYSIFLGEWCEEQVVLPITNSKNYFEIVGKLSELTDKNCEEFVKKMPFSFSDRYLLYIPYLYSPEHTDSAKESFISLLKSEGIDTSKEWLIILVC